MGIFDRSGNVLGLDVGDGQSSGGGGSPSVNENLRVKPVSVAKDEFGGSPDVSIGGILHLAQDVFDIHESFQSIQEAGRSNRENKRAASQLADRAKLEFEARGRLSSRVLARQRAAFAGAGVAPGGTQEAVQDFTSLERALERRLILNDAINEAIAFRREGRRRYKRHKLRGRTDAGKAIANAYLDLLALFTGNTDEREKAKREKRERDKK